MNNTNIVKLHTHYDYLRKLESLKLEALFSANYAAPAAPSIKSINHKGITWEISLVHGQTCQMYSHFNDIDHQIYVVHVDAQKFYNHWLKSSLFLNKPKNREINCLLRKDMPNDHKFHRAAAGFANSLSNPVQLAILYPRKEQGHDCIIFSNGVTRTIWLLANGAKSFPIEVEHQETAEYLYKLVGVGEPPLSNQEYKDRHNIQKPYELTQDYYDSIKDEWLNDPDMIPEK